MNRCFSHAKLNQLIFMNFHFMFIEENSHGVKCETKSILWLSLNEIKGETCSHSSGDRNLIWWSIGKSFWCASILIDHDHCRWRLKALILDSFRRNRKVWFWGWLIVREHPQVTSVRNVLFSSPFHPTSSGVVFIAATFLVLVTFYLASFPSLLSPAPFIRRNADVSCE